MAGKEIIRLRLKLLDNIQVIHGVLKGAVYARDPIKFKIIASSHRLYFSVFRCIAGIKSTKLNHCPSLSPHLNNSQHQPSIDMN